jgi:Xaa-Pro aminopeptidase
VRAAEYECKVRGAQRLAYPVVVAGGPDACTIHYLKNDKVRTAATLWAGVAREGPALVFVMSDDPTLRADTYHITCRASAIDLTIAQRVREGTALVYGNER